MTLVDPSTAVAPPTVDRVRELTEELAAPLSAEDQTVQSMPDVSPTKWHRAHTTWFFETFVLEPHLPGYHRFDDEFAYLFNSYYEAVGDRHPRAERGLLSRPGADEVGRYRRHVDAGLARLLDRGVDDDVARLVELGLHHEQQHQELLCMDITHVLSVHPFSPAHSPRSDSADRSDSAHRTNSVHRTDSDAAAPAPSWLHHPGGVVEVGHHGAGFAFDNEGPRHRVLLEPFEVATRLVTCGEWLEFVDDGGYRRAELWMSDGWATSCAQQWGAPLYWRDDGDGWTDFGLTGRRPIDLSAPVAHVSWYEADAYARWRGVRLPTEAEWEVVAGDPLPGAHLDLEVLSPRPAGSSVDAQQWFGELWQWTESAYRPYPRYRPPSGAIGEYNGKFMVNQQVLRGSSCATPPGHARRTYRNFFPPASRWVYAGVRLARDAD
jgi:ergothioneine biosynthesis protein EgtB